MSTKPIILHILRMKQWMNWNQSNEAQKQDCDMLAPVNHLLLLQIQSRPSSQCSHPKTVPLSLFPEGGTGEREWEQATVWMKNVS
mmetsp:Transcript_53994/g.89866  ORF Transcript_53994/g.89866 Transcript_53994/m.89866 type:complete len:85 (+) Transcript_53994:125-379(+)